MFYVSAGKLRSMSLKQSGLAVTDAFGKGDLTLVPPAFDTLVRNGLNQFTMPETALVIVDVQNDFCQGGSLAVPDGDAVIDVINTLRQKLEPVVSLVCLTQDWHPKGHCSFQSTHAAEGAQLFHPFKLEDGEDQMMWPDHCVQGSKGAEFREGLVVLGTDRIVKKGTDVKVDSYSGFFDNNKKCHTELDAILKSHKIERIILAGLAFDYCVGFTALDAVELGYEVALVEDATRPVAEESAKEMRSKLQKAGVKLVMAAEVKAPLVIQFSRAHC
ncbi:NAD(+) salvage pathway protein [Perkinsus chesapeaki]|uniref:nicotinamidase n=1 Tax=Perkinsus chesapeaki TaxID=330153 RepID=A0A7J6MKE5_PERCH|nr:NAD(+) salvage pathway protein [Perkinsus chesapeaki]